MKADIQTKYQNRDAPDTMPMVYTFTVEITAGCIASAAIDMKKNQQEKRYQNNDNCHQKTGV
jgi:hypothetical protein